MRGELQSLTSARGVAAWLVVLYHARSGMDWAPGWMTAVLDKGYLAVDFFFLLSGFVIYLSAHRALLKERAAGVPYFLGRRFARIYPLYGFMLALTVAFAAMLAATGREDANYPWEELPLHIAMMQNWGFTQTLAWNHPAWSISAEFAAYLLFPILLLWTPIAKARRPNLLAAMMLTIALMFFLLHYSGQVTLNDDIPRFGLVRCLTEFACGMMLCAFWLRGPDSEPRAIPFAASGVLLFWGLWALGLGSEIWAFPAGATCLILTLAHASCLRRNPLHWRPLLWLGAASYATYMVHYMAFIWFKIAFVSDAELIPPHQIGAFLLIVLAASAALHHGVEKRGRRLLTSIRPRPAQRRVAGQR